MSRPKTPYEKRFWAIVDRDGPGGCWLWRGWLSRKGYGLFGKPTKRAHRISYELLVGPIPPDKQLDHLCRVRHCVNPAHLEAVTTQENTRRGRPVVHTHCHHGHPFDEANTLWRRTCKACNERRARARRTRINKQSGPGGKPGAAGEAPAVTGTTGAA